MASLIEQLVQTHGSEVASQLSGKLGISEDKAAGLLPALAPMILGGLQRQAQEHGGADRVDHILDKHADESVLDNLGDFFSRKADEPAEQADPGLGGLLGGAGGQASQMIGNQLGLSQDQANQIIPMLAPIILGFLTRQRNQAGGGSQGQSLIMGMLDQDGDGSILDDVAGMLGGGSLLGSLLGGGAAPQPGKTSGGGSLLGNVLGGLLGRKK
ncbi:MAG: DUF937 domain-containing protein [Verrucomicrobiae bacterium]|nr:DUF937 domain-containing protein [Verrucomicrobiae bacterium]